MTTIRYCPNCATVYAGTPIQECESCHQNVTDFDLVVPAADLAEQDKAERNYRSAIRSVVRGLWAGIFDLDQAFDVGETSIRFGLTQAWNAGLKSVGVLPSEQSPEQKIELQRIINLETSLLFPFLLDIEAGSKANGGKLKPQMVRGEMWALRATDVESRARVSAENDPKLMFVLGQTKEHCGSCLKLAGKVKRASTWRRLGIRPQAPPNPLLDCGGWKCLCFFEPTTEPLSRGPLPRLP